MGSPGGEQSALGLDVEGLRAIFDARVAAVAPESAERAHTALADLDPEQWTIEWFLPSWLGSKYALPAPVVHDLTLSNLLGLVAVRTLDDLADDAVPAIERHAAQEMADALLAEAVRPYRGWFEPGSSFWTRFDTWLAEWRETLAGRRVADESLSARGAPLKAAALAACLLAGRPQDAPRLEDLLDEALTALVLWDDLVDWEDDVAAGRWNALVEQAARGRPEPSSAQQRWDSVLLGLVATDALETYAARIAAACARAERLALEADLPLLADYLRGFAARAEPHVDALRLWVRDVRERGAATADRIELDDRAAPQPLRVGGR